MIFEFLSLICFRRLEIISTQHMRNGSLTIKMSTQFGGRMWLQSNKLAFSSAPFCLAIYPIMLVGKQFASTVWSYQVLCSSQKVTGKNQNRTQSFVSGFLTYPVFIAVCRFIIGTQTGAIIVVSWSLTTELISPRTRFLARAFANWVQ